jgi:hypothetical protein
MYRDNETVKYQNPTNFNILPQSRLWKKGN